MDYKDYNYKLYQADINCEYVFQDYDESKFNLDRDYKLVYCDRVRCGDGSDLGGVAELLFMIWNSDSRPAGAHARSMSVSDVVEVEGVKFYCNGIGFKEIK